VKVLNKAFASSVVLKSKKPQRKRINYCSKHSVKMQWVVQKCLTGSRRFKEGRTSVECDLRSGRPSTSRNEEMIVKDRTIVRSNRRLTVREVLRRLRESVRRKRPEKWRDGDWILHHNNAPAHTSHLVQQFLAKHGTAQLQQPPYSPDLAPCEFFLFPRLKKVLKGHRFEATEDTKRNSTKTL